MIYKLFDDVQYQIWREKSTTTPSLLPVIRSKAAAHRHQVHHLFVSSSYLQGSGRTVFVAQPQKRSIFQQHSPSNVGDLVYKNKNRYYYFATYFMVNVALIWVVFNSAMLVAGYGLKDANLDEATASTFMSVALVFSTVLYLSSHALLSRTMFYIYYNESTHRFLGVSYNWRMAPKNLVFKPGDVQLVESSRARQFLRGSYRIYQQPYHIASRDFISPRHYNLMIGSIKP